MSLTKRVRCPFGVASFSKLCVVMSWSQRAHTVACCLSCRDCSAIIATQLYKLMGSESLPPYKIHIIRLDNPVFYVCIFRFPFCKYSRSIKARLGRQAMLYYAGLTSKRLTNQRYWKNVKMLNLLWTNHFNKYWLIPVPTRWCWNATIVTRRIFFTKTICGI